jgi:hypothetical protein
MSVHPANTILTRAAREVLKPMGLVQKGRSRVWLDDHGWWVIVVEFQPSRFGVSAYLNVGVCWLWDFSNDSWHFDVGSRIVGAGASFEDEEQWRTASESLAERAADEVFRLRRLVPDLPAAAQVTAQMLADNDDEDPRLIAGWPAWFAAVSNGLVADPAYAAAVFLRVAESEDDRDWWLPVKKQAVRWGQLVESNHSAYVEEVREMVRRSREEKRLVADHSALAIPVLGHRDSDRGSLS